MTEIFKAAIEKGASDIHLKSGDVVRARIHGTLYPLTEQKLTHEQVRQIALKLIPHERDRQRVDELLDYDCSWGLPGLGRFRVNILRQRGTFSIIMRVIPIEIPTFGSRTRLCQMVAGERGVKSSAPSSTTNHNGSTRGNPSASTVPIRARCPRSSRKSCSSSSVSFGMGGS